MKKTSRIKRLLLDNNTYIIFLALFVSCASYYGDMPHAEASMEKALARFYELFPGAVEVECVEKYGFYHVGFLNHTVKNEYGTDERSSAWLDKNADLVFVEVSAHPDELPQNILENNRVYTDNGYGYYSVHACARSGFQYYRIELEPPLVIEEGIFSDAGSDARPCYNVDNTEIFYTLEGRILASEPIKRYYGAAEIESIPVLPEIGNWINENYEGAAIFDFKYCRESDVPYLARFSVDNTAYSVFFDSEYNYVMSPAI